MNNVLSIDTIAYATAARAVGIAMEEAAARGVQAVVTVADPAMAIVAFGRADGATPHSTETSRRKAATAASTRRASSSMRMDLAVALEHGSGGLLTSIAGGVPIAFGGSHVGGLGVAGGSPEQDFEIAVAALAALFADPLPTAS